jgi:hypothetical protein
MSGRNIFDGEPMALRVMVTIDFGDEMHFLARSIR